MRSLDLAGLAARIGDLAIGISEVDQVLLDRAAHVIEMEARRAAGDHQGTVVSSTLRHSDLCDSIERTVRAPHAQVGSNHPEMGCQELGSQISHPGSLLMGSAFRKGTEIRDLIGDQFFHYITGIGECGIRVQIL